MTIRDIRLLECSFRYNDKAKSVESAGDIEMLYKTNHDKKKKEITIFFRLLQNNEDAPVIFDIVYGGKFVLEDNEEEHVDTFCQKNCPSIIMPYAREFLSDLTRRAGLPGLFLNTVNFTEQPDRVLISPESEDCSKSLPTRRKKSSRPKSS